MSHVLDGPRHHYIFIMFSASAVTVRWVIVEGEQVPVAGGMGACPTFYSIGHDSPWAMGKVKYLMMITPDYPHDHTGSDNKSSLDLLS